jgi:Flp pilus assembly protein CpaB
MKPFILPFIAGLVLSSVGVAAAAFLAVTPRLEAMRKAWALTPVVVMAEDLRMGEPVIYDVISQRSIPAQFVTDSMVKPSDAPFVVGRPATMALQKGDVLLMGVFADHSAPDACFMAIAPKVNAAGEVARDEAISRFEERMGSPLPKPDPVPALKEDASGEYSLVVAKTDISEGTVIDESMLTVGKFPGLMVTASFVTAEQLRDLVGTRAVRPIQAKDALMWQLLDAAQRPRRVVSCAIEANAAQDEARKRTTREETAAYVRSLEKP